MAAIETRAAANRTTRDLTDAQRRLVAVMSAHQFGRIENLSVQAGQPVFDGDVRIVRVAPSVARAVAPRCRRVTTSN